MTHFAYTVSAHSYIASDYVICVFIDVHRTSHVRSPPARAALADYKVLQDPTIQFPQFASNLRRFMTTSGAKNRSHKEVMLRTNATNRTSASLVKARTAKAAAATGLAAALLTLAGCAYEPPPQPRLPYRGDETTNPAYQPNCGPPPYAAGTPCSPYAAPPSPAPTTDAYGRPYPPTDGYGRPYPSDAQGRPYPPAPLPPAYRETYPANGTGAPTPGSETAH